MATSRRASPLVTPGVHFKVRQLALIDALGHTASLRGAADQIHVSQPAATRLLQEVEDGLGVSLFERTRQGMRATFAGQVMIRHARFLLSSMVTAQVETVETASGNAGTVRIGVSGAIDPELLSTTLAQLHEKNPFLRVVLKEAPQEMLFDALKRAELDVVIGRVNTPDPADALDFEALYVQQFAVVASSANPISRRKRLTLSQLCEATWILPPRETLLRQGLEALFLVEVGGMPQSYIESASLMSNMALIRKSNMIGFLPTQLAQWLSEAGGVRILPVDVEEISRPVAMATVRNQARSPAVQYVIDLFRMRSQTMQSALRTSASRA